MTLEEIGKLYENENRITEGRKNMLTRKDYILGDVYGTINRQIIDAPSFADIAKFMSDYIVNIEVIVPNKVVVVSFYDSKEKMVCHQDDTFDLRRCLFLAIAKRKYKSELTPEGIEHKATELSYQKKYVKIVNKALKAYSKKVAEEAELEEKRINEEKYAAKRQAKKEAYRVRREQKRKDAERAEKINIQKEAIIRAMEYMNSKEE